MTDVALVGEAFGEKEEELGVSFVGTSGWLLDQLLSQVGIARRECLVTDVFRLRPRPSNDIKNLCGPKAQALDGFPALSPGKYIRNEFRPELDRLYKELRNARPNIIIALGATAAWAILRSSGIKSLRGAIAISHPRVSEEIGYACKVLPTYHPSAVARQWNLRPIVLADLDKAKRHSTSPDYARPSRKVWLRPSFQDLLDYEQQHLSGCELLSADIETRQDQITCIGFAPSPSTAIVIPFFTESGVSYWKTKEEEVAVWKIIARWLAAYPTLFQNGMYDINFLWNKYGIPVPRAAEDTMLLHHAFQPEMEKGLGFLATIYTEEASWKFMSKGRKHD